MIRDPGPLYNLGSGVTSRDIPYQPDEKEGDAPNAGFIGRALNDHPVMRFVAASATTMVVAAVASKMFKKGGLRLAKFAEDKAEASAATSLLSRGTEGIKRIRKALDEYQGVHRYVDDEIDPYSKLVFGEGDNLTTGYQGVSSERFGFGFLTKEERRLAGNRNSFSFGNSTVMWSFRDELQQRLVRAGRRLPYELPALYAGQKAIVDPLFGERDDPTKKVKWYNPVDVITDFTKESIINTATMILPFEAAGAAGSQFKNSIHTLKFAENNIRNMTPRQQKMYNKFVDVNQLLNQVGHDFAKVTNKLVKKTTQATGAFQEAGEAYQQNQKSFVDNLWSLRHGLKKARLDVQSGVLARDQLRKTQFETLFKGTLDSSGERFSTVFDLVPAFRGISSGFPKFRDAYKKYGTAYDAMDGTIAFNRAIADSRGVFHNSPNDLAHTIQKIQAMHGSKLSSLAQGLNTLGRGGPDSGKFSSSTFYMQKQEQAAKQLLKKQLTSRGMNSDDVDLFVHQLDIKSIPKAKSDVTGIVTIGKQQIIESGNTPEELSSDFFSEILKRYQGIKGGKELIDAGLTSDVLEKSVESAKNIFTSREFKRKLNNEIKKDWNKFYRDDMHKVASDILKPKKPTFEDFIGDQTSAKLEFLQRKTAETAGIKLTGANGSIVSTDIVNQQLQKRGIDPNNYTDLRAYLIKNKKMSSGIFSGGLNLFGLEQVTIDEAHQRGMFSHLGEGEQDIIRELAGRTAIRDPISRSIGLSRVEGVYKTQSGDILDFNKVKSTASNVLNFFGSEFKIPILNFNPFTDLFGYSSFKEMGKRNPIQFISSESVQPFLGKLEGPRPDFYLFNKTSRFKGVVTSYVRDETTGDLVSEQLKGTYRSIPTNSMDLLTRHTRYASGLSGDNPEQIRKNLQSGFLNRLLNTTQNPDRIEKALKVKDRFAVASEQPNSLFGQLKRFRERRYDPNNPAVMARLLGGEEITIGRGRSARRASLQAIEPPSGSDVGKIGKQIRLVDTSGNIVEDISEKNIISAFNMFRRETFQSGFSPKLVKKLEEDYPDLFKLAGTGVSELESPKQLLDYVRTLEGIQPALTRDMRSAGKDPIPLRTAFSRISRLVEQSDLTSVSMLAERSPTITTKFDELKNEIFRYIAQTNQLTKGNLAGDDMFIKIQQAITSMINDRKLSVAQQIEAQAAGLSTVINLSAFKTFRQDVANVGGPRKLIKETMDVLRSSPEMKAMLTPYSEGQIARLTGTFGERFGSISAAIKKGMGTSPYRLDDLAVDPLGSGQYATLVPTFGTAFARNPVKALKNVSGLTTYSDPESFSLSSVPVSQGVDRLNRYFGTLGMQLDVSKFKGPLDMFARGMVGKRVVPLYAAGTTALAIDRTMGGMVNERDDRGERVYSPLVLGSAAKVGVEAHAFAAGLIPGGMGYQDKKEQLVEGEVPIRQGRFWPLGNTPFQGGKIMYYRPSWYRKLQGGALFTSDTYGSPAEKALFYNDISPLRPLDPYRFERKHYEDRPYPVTGEYFTGPFGPLVPFANMTIGKLLKPQRLMHEEELATGLAGYAPAGQSGAYDTTAYSSGVSGTGFGYSGGTGGYGGGISGLGGGAPIGGPVGFGGGRGFYSGPQGQMNREMASRAGSTFTARNMTRANLADVNSRYLDMSYGPPKVSRVMNPRIVPAGTPIKQGGAEFQSTEFGFKTQEMLGIYGFAGGALRQSLGLGQADLEPQRSVLQSASKAYGSTRAFWDLNLGGLGDVPIGGTEGVGNIEFSEIVRRFIPKERTGVDFVNPIRNKMGQQYPFLPGSEYYINFQTGDPFTKVQEGELRLPGVGYERFNKLHPDETGRYGLIDQLNILADVAPYSQQFKRVNAALNKKMLTPEEKEEVSTIRSQVEDTTSRHQFSDYVYKNSSPEELGMSPIRFGINKIGETLAHSDNFIMSKISGKRTAIEDWERSNVYGTTFPQWSSPIKSYIEPMAYESTQKNPIVAAAGLAAIGSMFGRTQRARMFGATFGAVLGGGSSLAGNAYEMITGERFIPTERKKELALEEYSDIMNYVKNTRLSRMAQASGDSAAATQFSAAARRTMYGANLDNPNIENLSFALPKRKREHFIAMMNAPVEDRQRILSTAGRLERRMYEAAWGMQVEEKPDLVDYFTKHELPDENWEGWHPNTNIDHVKIKTGQHMGLDMSQMGYYPQQIKEANLANPSFPDFFGTNNSGDVRAQLQRLMSGSGLSGTITPVYNPFGSQQINVSAGVR